MGDADEPSIAATLQRTQAPAGGASAPAEIPRGEDRYEALGVLGEGGMGRVLEAMDRQFSRVVAIKELLGAGGDAARLRTEALVTGNLEHPGVPPVYKRGVRPDGTPYYVMRRVRGRALEEALADAGDLHARLGFLPAITRAAQTLGFAHEKGVVHRDVKPQNIMVGSHGEVFVVDWGLARVGQLSGSSGDSGPGAATLPQQTVQGAVMGTPAYMAPEQARGDTALVDARTDVFALGAVLYRLLAGRPPYDGSSTAEVLERARRGDHPGIDQAAPKAPEPLRAICRKAMAARPDDRFATAQHLADALERFSSGAVERAYEKPAGRVAAVSLAFGILATLFGLSGLTRFAPTRYLLGPELVIGLTFVSISFALAWFEARSRGRLRLAPLGYAMAVNTFLTGWIGAGFAVLTAPSLKEAAAQAATAVVLNSLLCAFALGAWGLVVRSSAPDRT